MTLPKSFVSTINKFSFEKRNRKYIELFTEFISKWQHHNEYFNGFSQTFVFEKIKETIDNFLILNPNYIVFDLTADCSVFFQTLINGFNIYFELYFTNDSDNSVEAIINIYDNGECIFAYSGSIEVVFSKISSKV